jgi:hypothetical protein
LHEANETPSYEAKPHDHHEGDQSGEKKYYSLPTALSRGGFGDMCRILHFIQPLHIVHLLSPPFGVDE